MGMTSVVEDMIGEASGETTVHTTGDGADRGAAASCGHRLGDADCRARACRLFDEIVGASSGVLRWDEKHHLQAHAHVGDRDYVLIAPRDEEHEPILLDKEDWDHVSHTVGPERAALLRHYAIRRHI
jgi:hypothetical protein